MRMGMEMGKEKAEEERVVSSLFPFREQSSLT